MTVAPDDAEERPWLRHHPSSYEEVFRWVALFEALSLDRSASFLAEAGLGGAGTPVVRAVARRFLVGTWPVFEDRECGTDDVGRWRDAMEEIAASEGAALAQTLFRFVTSGAGSALADRVNSSTTRLFRFRRHSSEGRSDGPPISATARQVVFDGLDRLLAEVEPMEDRYRSVDEAGAFSSWDKALYERHEELGSSPMLPLLFAAQVRVNSAFLEELRTRLAWDDWSALEAWAGGL